MEPSSFRCNNSTRPLQFARLLLGRRAISQVSVVECPTIITSAKVIAFSVIHSHSNGTVAILKGLSLGQGIL